MSAGEASVFPRIDPDDPLARAARETNAYAEQHGLEATLEWLGVTAGAGELAYLAEQRALRAIAAATLGVADVDETICRAIMATPLWRDMRPLMLGLFMDGATIGYRAAQMAEWEATGRGTWLEDLAEHWESEADYFEREGEDDTAAEWRAKAEAVRARLDGGADG